MGLDLLLLVVGLALLVKGGDWLVTGATSLARTWGVPDIVIGLTIVAFGTSMPEFAVSLLAGLRGAPTIAVANVVGSNTANVLLILGIAALIRPLSAPGATVWKEIPFMMLAAVMLAVQVNDIALDGAERGILTRSDGLAMLALFAVFLYYLAQVVIAPANRARREPGRSRAPLWPQFLRALAGLVALFAGGHGVVRGAVALAEGLGVSQNLIGLTIVAVGTSLPELATSAVAAYKGNSDIAVGNIVGSNIFNVLWILGFTSLVAPLPVDASANPDIAIMLIATFLLFAAMLVGRPRHEIQRYEGAGFLVLYVAYVAWLAARG